MKWPQPLLLVFAAVGLEAARIGTLKVQLQQGNALRQPGQQPVPPQLGVAVLIPGSGVTAAATTGQANTDHLEFQQGPVPPQPPGLPQFPNALMPSPNGLTQLSALPPLPPLPAVPELPPVPQASFPPVQPVQQSTPASISRGPQSSGLQAESMDQKSVDALLAQNEAMLAQYTTAWQAQSPVSHPVNATPVALPTIQHIGSSAVVGQQPVVIAQASDQQQQQQQLGYSTQVGMPGLQQPALLAPAMLPVRTQPGQAVPLRQPAVSASVQTAPLNRPPPQAQESKPQNPSETHHAVSSNPVNALAVPVSTNPQQTSQYMATPASAPSSIAPQLFLELPTPAEATAVAQPLLHVEPPGLPSPQMALRVPHAQEQTIPSSESIADPSSPRKPAAPPAGSNFAFGQYPPWIAAQMPQYGPMFAGMQQGPGQQFAGVQQFVPSSAFMYNPTSQMMSNLQMQYRMQLAQYQEQQQAFADWAKKYQQYQQTYAVQKQQYDDYNRYQEQQRQGTSQRNLRGRTNQQQRGALVQLNTKSSSTEVESIQAEERAMAERARILLAQQAALKKKALQLRAEELADRQEEKQLSARESSLTQKEKRLGVLQGELMQEQRKIWKILQSRGLGPVVAQHVDGPQASMIASVAPSQSAQEGAITGSGTRAIDTRRVLANSQAFARAQQPPVQQGVAAQQGQPQMMAFGVGGPFAPEPSQAAAGIALAQTSAGAGVSARTVTGAGTGMGMAASSDDSSNGQSDLHVVMAARVPPEADAGSGDEDSNRGTLNSPPSDEDSTPTSQEDQRGQDADNDDLEQILLQQQSSHLQRTSDAVELQG